MNWETATLAAILGGSFGLAIANLASHCRRKAPPKEPRESFTSTSSEDLLIEEALRTPATPKIDDLDEVPTKDSGREQGIESRRREASKTRRGPVATGVKAKVRCRVWKAVGHGRVLVADCHMRDISEVEVWIVLKYDVDIPQLADLECYGRCWHDGRLFEIELGDSI